MKFTKILTITALSAVLLSGCFGGGEEDGSTISTSGNKGVYQADTFAVSYPLDWDVIEGSNFTSNIPLGTAVGFVNNVKSNRFTANANVHITNFTEEIGPQDFAISSMQQARDMLTSMSENEIQEISITVGDQAITGYLLGFSGKSNANAPTVVFKQIVTVHNQQGYTVTGAYLADEEESVVNKVDEMVNSFALR